MEDYLNANTSFSITAEECERLEEEYTINDIIVFLHKAGTRVGYDKTIHAAIDELMNKTRFKNELENLIKKNTYVL